jgi:hypothetical protein
MNIEGYIRTGDVEVYTYKDARGLVTAELFYKGVVQTRLSKAMMNLMALAIETLEDN